MSLFKSREWWAINLNENELYDSQCLLISSMGANHNDTIVVGNHEGLLRLYSPSSDITDEGVVGYKPSDLLLEVQLSSPILQINEGVLVSGSQEKFLAVLHPRLFSVYAFKKKESKETAVGDQMIIELGYQLTLKHSAHSFVLGSFGKVRGRTFICIQSLDGLLSFYEQESFAFQLYLPTFILPFTFAYLEKTDSFLFLNGLLVFDCYTYEALASAGSSNDKKVIKTWDYNLGEGILDIKTVLKNGLVIIVLSERNLLGLNENGKVLFMKRLEFKPVALCSYVTQENTRLINVIATDGNFLNFYDETNLKWSMKIDQVPVSVERIFLKNLTGGIVLLTENGYIQIVYIGTHPSVYLVPPLIQPDINYLEADKELRQLQQKISGNDFGDPLVTDLVGVELKIDKAIKTDNGNKFCNVIVEINVECSISKLQVLFVVEPPLTTTKTSVILQNCSEKTFVETSVCLKQNGVVSNLNFKVVVTYTQNEGIARSVEKEGVLPLTLVVSECPAVKETLHKITLTTNKPVCGMDQLFRDFAVEEALSNVIGVKFTNSEDIVTILAAKSSQRYRLQSDNLACIAILLAVLIERLKAHFRKDFDFTLTYSTTLPLDAFLEKIEMHHDLIMKKKNKEKQLLQQTSQYRTVQKKILSNLKDVTPKPASNLHKILKYTSEMISATVDELEEVENELFLSKCTISALNRLLISLIGLMNIAEKDMKVLQMVFNPKMHDTEKQGWLEVQEAAASFLLRTVLAKSEKDQQKPTDISLDPLQDTSKLSKHFSSILDRVTKGTHLLERSEFECKKEPLTTIQAGFESEEGFPDEVIPPGLKYLNLKNSEAENIQKIKVPKEEDQKTTYVKMEKRKEEEETKMAEDLKAEEKSPEREVVKSPEKKVIKPDFQEDDDNDDDDDAIWDIKIDEMRI